MDGGASLALAVSRPAQCVLVFRPAWALSHLRDPLALQCLNVCRYLHAPPRLLPSGAIVDGRDSDPLKTRILPQRTLDLKSKYYPVNYM